MAKLCVFTVVCLFATIYFTDCTEDTNAESKNNVAEEFKTQAAQERSYKCSENSLNQRRQLERDLVNQGRTIKLSVRKTDSSLIRNFKVDPTIHQMEFAQLPFEEASRRLASRYNLSSLVIINDLPNTDIKGELGNQFRRSCTDSVGTAECDSYSQYRRADGQCNNLQNPRWGSAMNCQPRLLPPNYEGVSGLRLSVNGGPLPGPRNLSLYVHSHYNRPTNYVNHMYMFFGQLLDHDIALTPFSTAEGNEAIECCPPGEQNHPQCAPILIPEDDPFYSQFNVTCMNFVRSSICPTCELGPRQLMNQVTSTIDASFVYGNSENETRSLRRNDGTGRLRTLNTANGELLPQSQDPANDQCSFPETNDICFEAGDSRANQHTVLTSLHTIFVREHNRIATILGNINPFWDDERIFQETRRILGAEMQSITYKEYLPITLDDDRMSYFRLWPGKNTRYDSSEDPTTLLEFTTAAFRFGHTLVNSLVTRRPLNATGQPRLLRNEFFQPFTLYEGTAGPLVQGATDSPAQWFDRHLVSDVRNFLYRIRGNATGLDLAAINIQRGRDHGIPTYVDTVQYCSNGQIIIRNFNDLLNYDLMENSQVNALYRNYRFVQDVDLWTGIVSEKYKEGSVVGPTAACIIGLQFRKLKFGDRFYFEHRNQAGSFTYEQLRELRQITLSQIICLNTEVNRLPMNAMLFNSRNNQYIDCRSVRGINLSYWAE